jgi:hypothetical protein
MQRLRPACRLLSSRPASRRRASSLAFGFEPKRFTYRSGLALTMTSYIVHQIFSVTLPGQKSDEPIDIWENIVCVNADSDATATLEAKTFGTRDEAESNPVWLDGKPAIFRYRGWRYMHASIQGVFVESGTELAYIKYVVSCENDLSKLLLGDDASVNLISCW